MSPNEARPVLLFDVEPPLLGAIDDVVRGQPTRRPLMVLNRQPSFRSYLQSAAAAGELPALMIVRIRSAESDDQGLQLTRWLGAQSGPLGSVPVVAIGYLPFARAVPPYCVIKPGDLASLEAAVKQALDAETNGSA